MKCFQEWHRMRKPKRPSDNHSQAVLNTVKFCDILRGNVIKKRVAEIKSTSNVTLII